MVHMRMGERGRDRVVAAAFLVFVVLLPVWAAIAWTGFQRDVVRREDQIAACERANEVREYLNLHETEQKERVLTLAEIMGLSAAEKRRLDEEHSLPVLVIFDCEEIIR